MIVLDTSVVVELLLVTSAAATIEDRLFRSGETRHARPLNDIEVAQTLRRLAMQCALAADRGGDTLTDLVDLPIRRYPHGWLLGFAWACDRTSPPTTPCTSPWPMSSMRRC